MLDGSSATIRLAKPTDREAIVRLINTIASEGQHLQTNRYHATATWEQILIRSLDTKVGHILMTVIVEKNIIGFGRLTTDWNIEGVRSVGNIGLGLLPAYRGQGIGSRLLTELIQWAPTLAFKKLNAAILLQNVRSQQLFRNSGFSESQRRLIKVPFAQTDLEEVIMELPIG